MQSGADMDNSSQVRVAGWIVLATALANIVFMLHHPVGHDTGGMAQIVHGALQFVILLQFAALLIVMRSVCFSLAVVIAAIFLGAGQLAGVLAATINGFAVPALGAYGDSEIGRDVALFAWELNQALARLGVVAVGIAFAALAFGLWRTGRRILAAFGLVAGLVPLALVVTATIEMDLHGALIAYLTQSAFLIAFGWVFARKDAVDMAA